MSRLSAFAIAALVFASTPNALGAESNSCPSNSRILLSKIDKRVQLVRGLLQNARAYEKETAELVKESKNVANLSTAIATVSATLYGGIAFVEAGGAIDVALIGTNTGITAVKNAALYSQFSTLAMLADYGMMGNSLVTAIKTKGPSEEKGAATASKLSSEVFGKYDEGHAAIAKIRNSIDMNYSNLANGLSLGRKGNKAMNALHDTVVADRKLYESEMSYLNFIRGAVGSTCSDAMISVNRAKRLTNYIVDSSNSVDVPVLTQVTNPAGSLR